MAIADDPDPAVRRLQLFRFVLDSCAQGKTYHSIAKELGVSRYYALYLARKAKRDFYRKINPPRYNTTMPQPMHSYEVYVLHNLKDFLLEIAE